MYLRTFLLFFLFFTFRFAVAQRDIEGQEKVAFKDRVYFGGGGTFQLDNRFLVLGASPIMGYMITPRFSSGVGVTYQYTHYKFLDQSSHTYGGRLFSRYNLFSSVYTMVEYELLNIGLPRVASEVPRVWAERLLLGGGYFQRFPGNRGGFNIGVLYDVFFQYGGQGPYTSPWVYRVGFTF